MQVAEETIHEFHFVLDEGLESKLQALKREADVQSLTKFITGVPELLFPWLEYEHFFGKERQTRYGFVNDDPGVPRLHMHVNLSYSLYKRLNLIYQDLNFYAIAQLVRWSLGEFIRLAKRYGERVREVVVEQLKCRCAATGINLDVDETSQLKSGNKKVDFNRRKIRQLLKILIKDLSKISLITCYDGLSFPKMIFKC